ncbi:alpha/beta fold hydrolase [Georgenia halophila]|uniref:Alpha/beta fold hydrolase n=1 Tax=Georgenia halophila TaxID=620889 RepID=A0ABP8LNW4_9MICO
MWHYLDNASSVDGAPRGTVLAVHGNPTWSFLWRSVLAAGAGAGWRVVAVDQLEMGLSERTGAHHRLADRVAQLGELTDQLGLSGPDWDGREVVTLGHDWGGIVSAGWAIDHPRELAGVTLTNTALHQPPGHAIPLLLRLVRHRKVHEGATTRTPAFLETALALAKGLDPDERTAYRVPYRTAADRHGVGGFVEDIPATRAHPSHAELERIATGVTELSVPTLLMWGPRDPVFYERYLHDLMARFPHADVHRFEGAGHLLPEDADISSTIVRWLESTFETPTTTAHARAGAVSAGDGQAGGTAPFRPVHAALEDLGAEGTDTAGTTAVVALGGDGLTELSWGDLSRRVHHLAHGLADSGVAAGDRVALVIPPGVDLTTALFACLRLGAVVVLADAGLGLRGLTRAVRGAYPDHVLAIEKALVAASALRWPGQKFVVVPAGHEAGYTPPRTAHSRRRTFGIAGSMRELLARGATLADEGAELPPEPGPDDDAAILFTSGSTGPAKGVVHTHRGLAGMRDVVGSTYGLSPDRPFVAGFAPFALLGTALGATSATPDMDVMAPSSLTAPALADAAGAIDAHAVFASPSALANVVRTAADLTDTQRGALAQVQLLLSAGAPITSDRLTRALETMPNASAHTPYGMTEVLPVTDIALEDIRDAEDDAAGRSVQGAGNGSCVGRPVPGAHVEVVPLDDDGAATGEPTTEAGVTGEVLVSAPHLKDRYDRLWATQEHSATWPGWHRTGDVGHLDAAGRLWIEGRLAHVIVTPSGVVTPVGLENAVVAVPLVTRAAVVGVGPAGTQRVAVVVETDRDVHRGARARPGLAPEGLTRAVRQACAPAGVAAVLRVPEIPTDVRHNSKVERARVAQWADRFLAGERPGRL